MHRISSISLKFDKFENDIQPISRCGIFNMNNLNRCFSFSFRSNIPPPGGAKYENFADKGFLCSSKNIIVHKYSTKESRDCVSTYRKSPPAQYLGISILGIKENRSGQNQPRGRYNIDVIIDELTRKSTLIIINPVLSWVY